MSMSWRHSSFSRKKKKQQQQQPIFLFQKKKMSEMFHWCEVCLSLSYRSLSPHTSNVFFADCPRIRAASVKLPDQFLLHCVVQPRLSLLWNHDWSQFEKDYPCLKTFPAHLITYNLKMNILGARDFSSVVSGFCQVFIADISLCVMCQPSTNTENSRRTRENYY